MTNFEKYKTPAEAYQAFRRICDKTLCEDCRYFCGWFNPRVSCQTKWLYADDEKDLARWQSNIMDKFTNRE
jgi:hypothetical protein